jgi:hypothetical protein
MNSLRAPFSESRLMREARCGVEALPDSQTHAGTGRRILQLCTSRLDARLSGRLRLERWSAAGSGMWPGVAGTRMPWRELWLRSGLTDSHHRMLAHLASHLPSA